MKQYFDLKGQVAIVTGCSGGLGVQMAKALANQGCNIVPVARRLDKLEEIAKEISEEYGVECLPLRLDITDTEAVERVVKEAYDHFGRIDILINNAGTGAVAPAEDITDEQFANEMEIDLFGTFKVARAVAKIAMIPAKYGRIINIASMYGLRPVPCRQRWRRQPDPRPCRRVGQVRHYGQCHLPRLLLHPADEGDPRLRLLPGERPHHDSRGAVRQRR